MLNTVIFDLDGTLLYTLEDLAASTNFALKKFGYCPRSIQEVRSFVGNGVRLLIERAIPDGINNKDFDECLAVFKKHYSSNMYNNTRPYEGVMDLLQELKKCGYKTAVVSNKFDAAVKDLCNKFFADKIDVAVGESSDVRKKPFPDSVLSVIKQLETVPANCVYVGDSEVDIQTARNAGIRCISVDWGYKDRDFLLKNGASVVVSGTRELLSELYKL